MRRSLGISFNILARKSDFHIMPPYADADIYVLAKSRTEAAVVEFLDYFAPEREQSAVDYWIPQYEDPPQQIFQAASEVVNYCCRHSTEMQSIYWRRVGDGEPEHVMVFFTSDAQLIFGLSVNENVADQFFAELQRHARSDIGYITFESPPPETAAEFCLLAQKPSA